MIRKEQILINKLKDDLPIIVFPEREILPKLRENFKDETISLKTEFEIHKMIDSGDMGGIICEIRVKELETSDSEAVFLCSITHFRIKRGEAGYQELEKYRLKRKARLAKQNRRNRFF